MIESGFVLGHYRIIRSLGSGGMADVYEAEDTRLGRRLALKVLPPELTRSGDLIERFEKEVRAAAALGHPNMVTLFESTTDLRVTPPRGSCCPAAGVVEAMAARSIPGC